MKKKLGKMVAKQYYCRDCQFVTDTFNKSVHGEDIMCRCTQNVFARLLSEKSCNKFKKKKVYESTL